MRWIARIAATMLVFAAGMGNAQQAPARLALVIGNAAYTTPGWQLVNPVNDARLIASRLAAPALGFQVIRIENATRAQMEAAMNAFAARLRSGGDEAVGVFYYAGHAAEHDGANLLVPVDVTARTMDELRFQAPPLNFMLRDMAQAGNRVNIVILDACRNLPLPAGTRAGPAGGLAGLDDVPTNVLLAYATRAGAIAPDNAGEANSVFTKTLADLLQSNANDPVSLLFERVQSRVAAATGFQQRPEFRNQLLRAEGFSLGAGRPRVVGPPVVVSEPPASGQATADLAAAKISEAAGRGAEARTTYLRSCDGRNGEACRLLGSMWEEGRGGASDFVTALSLYRRGCDYGDAFSCYGVGTMYEVGRGVPADANIARGFYQRSCDAGNSLYNAVGCSGLATLKAKGVGGPQDLIAARALFERSCTIGFALGCNGLATMYSGGLGGPRDLDRSRQLFQQACSAGYQPACAAN